MDIQARLLVDRLCADEQWMLMTRLLTGIQRYSEMNYVFVLLKEKDRFEYLLRKGMDRLPLLRTALLDFLRRNCAHDTELFRMVFPLFFLFHPLLSFRFTHRIRLRLQVALHFHMHTEVAGMWRREAQSILQPIIDSASAVSVKVSASPIRRPSSSGESVEGVTSIPMLKVTPELKERLTSAMHSMAHSAEYYLQVHPHSGISASSDVFTSSFYQLFRRES